MKPSVTAGSADDPPELQGPESSGTRWGDKRARGAGEVSPRPPALKRSRQIGSAAGSLAVVGSYILMIVVFAVAAPHSFLDVGNVKNVLDQAVVPVLLVCGLTFVLAAGEFDLSFTAVVGLSAGIVVKLIVGGLPIGLAIAISILTAVAIGLVVGVVVAFGRVSSFIITLAMSSILIGLEQALTGNATINQLPAAYSSLASNKLLGVHAPVWIAVVVAALAALLLHGTRFGRHAKASGANPTAAFLAGVKLRHVKVACFVIVAALSSLGAVILTSRASSYYPNSSSGFLLSSYAAVFLGAAAGRSGGFTILGSVFGVMWLTTLENGLVLTNQPAWFSNVVEGLILSAAVLLAAWSRRSDR